MANEALLRVEVVFAPAERVVRSVVLDLAAGSTVAEALQSGNLVHSPSDRRDINALEVGVWGRKVVLDHILRDRDRIELYRPLKVDPKVARRERFTQQGAKTAGLFAKRREGAKSGY